MRLMPLWLISEWDERKRKKKFQKDLCDSPQLSVHLKKLKSNVYVEEFAHFSLVAVISTMKAIFRQNGICKMKRIHDIT